MKQKLNVLIDEAVMQRVRRKAAEEARSISDLIQSALTEYLGGGAVRRGERKMAYHAFCDRPLELNPKQFRKLLGEDLWER